MNANELYKAGNLSEAIEAQIKEVKANPADNGKRIFLFEMLAFSGDLDRARRQIDAIKYTELEIDAAVMGYRKLLDAEQLRRRLLSEGLAPQLFGETPEHVRLRLEAINCIREKRTDDAAKLLSQANEAVPALKGQLNNLPFASLRDCDDLFASVLEVMAHGIYYWVPLDQVDGVFMNPPRFPRDLLWAPARLEMKGDVAGEVFLPTLYPGSHEHADVQVKLGRMTDWQGPDSGPILGAGLHTFLVDENPISLLEWRQVEIQ
jgi:type VI secretion system protein ImpE